VKLKRLGVCQMPKRVLIIDDDDRILEVLCEGLESQGYEVSQASRIETGIRVFSTEPCDAAIVDYSLPDGTALDIIPRLKALDATAPILVLTGHGTIDLAVKAMKLGAEHFITKPIQLEVIFDLLSRALQQQRSQRRNLVQRLEKARYKRDPFLGSSDAIGRLREQANKILGTHWPILIQGETGTGKGVLAQWLHQNGPRAEEAMVDLNCGSLSRELLDSELFGHERGAFTGATSQTGGLLEVANRGTLFLDEIGDMDVAIQPKLLKVVEEKRYRRVGGVQDRTVDVHLIAATNRDLRAFVAQDKFRSDLYFRINTIPISIPPLRDRAADIPVIADFFIKQLRNDLARAQLALSSAAVTALASYNWPGNIRELRNVLERAALLSESGTILPADLALPTTHVGAHESTDNPNPTLQEVERQYIIKILTLENRSVDKAAVRLGIPRSTLYVRLKQHGIALERVGTVGPEVRLT
jgi:DNA-binding NtrC family response regulator